MPLQIRRGTEAERQALTAPLADGEPLWITDTGQLYVGDGTTPAGNLIAINTDGIVIDFEGTVTSNVVPAEDSEYDLGSVDNKFRNLYLSSAGFYLGDAQMIASGSSIDLPPGSTVNGTLIGTANLVSIDNNIIPDTDSLYDLGSISNKFRDLYLTNNLFIGDAQINSSGLSINLPDATGILGDSFFIGDAVISSSGPRIELPLNSSIAGSFIVTEDSLPPAFIEGESYRIGINANSSTIMVDIDSETISAPNGFFGNVTGSIFNINSELLIDSNTSSIFANSIRVTENLEFGLDGSILTTFIDNRITFGDSVTGAALRINQGIDDPAIEFCGVTEGPFTDQPTMLFSSQRGTIDSPELIQNLDPLGIIIFGGYTGVSGSGYGKAAFISANVEDTNPLSEVSNFNASISLGTLNDAISGTAVKIRNGGIVDMPIAKVGTYTTTPVDNRPIGEKGMIIFNDTSGKFQGFNGSTWVDLS